MSYVSGSFASTSTPAVMIVPADVDRSAYAVSGVGGNDVSFGFSATTMAPFTLGGLFTWLPLPAGHSMWCSSVSSSTVGFLTGPTR